jgi:hypothetical protein
LKFLLIEAMGEGHLYAHFAHALCQALNELGHQATVSDQSANVVGGVAQTGPLVAELQAAKPDAVISFSSYFGNVALADGTSLFDALGVKFVGWQLDHPISAPGALGRKIVGRHAIYSNRNHLRYAKAVKLAGRGAVLLPGGSLPAAPAREFRDRRSAIFVAATWNGVPQALWEQAPDSPGKRLLMGVVAALRNDLRASLLDAFNATSSKLGLGARLGDDPAFDKMMHDFLREPLIHVRNLDRIAIIRALADSGLPVTICGRGWQEFLGERSNVTYVGRTHYRDMPALYGDARIVLNLNAGNGACERAVDAALSGAAVVSDHGEQLDRFLGTGQGVAFFNRAKPETVVEIAGELFETGRAEAIAQFGHHRAVHSGLWRHRAGQLVDFLQGAHEDADGGLRPFKVPAMEPPAAAADVAPAAPL